MERSIIFALIASVGALVLVLEMVRRQTLREEYSLLWLGTAFAMIIVSTWRDLLHGLAQLVGIAYPPNLLFLMASLFTLLLLLYFSTVITRLTQENKKIAQEVALLRHQIERLSADDTRHQQQDQQSTTEE
ncbi:MAG: DUF2304 domain-containing protein [Chloroflexota bacterium]